MKPNEDRREGLAIFLHFYTSKTYLRKSFIFYHEKEKTIHISGACLGTVRDVTVLLEYDESFWKLNGQPLSGDGYIIYKTPEEEELLIAMSFRKKQLGTQGRILLKEAFVSIGKAYQNKIFYDCFSFIEPVHISINKLKEAYFLENREQSNLYRRAKVYVNGRAVEGRIPLRKGDTIELLGLSVLFLKDILVCTVFFGDMRVALGKEQLTVLKESGFEAVNQSVSLIKKIVPEEQTLHEGEVEIEQPQPEKSMGNQPLLFTLGPSVTMVIPVLLMAWLGSAFMGGQEAGFYRMSVVMTGSAAFLSMFWGITSHYYRKRTGRRENEKRVENYLAYLQKTDQYLSRCHRENQTLLLQKYPDIRSYMGTAEKEEIYVYRNRNPGQKDFLFIRLGLGDIPFHMKVKLPVKNRELNLDPLIDKVYEISDRYRILQQVPVGIDLKENACVGFTGNGGIHGVLLQLLVQLAACHSSKQVKLCYFYQKEIPCQQEIADCIKWLPHVWDSKREIRFLAGNEKEAGELLPWLTKQLQLQAEKGHDICFYVIVTAEQNLIEGESIYNLLTEGSRKGKLSAVFLHPDREKLPAFCSCLVVKEKQREEILFYDKEFCRKQETILESCTAADAETYMRQMSGYGIQEKEQKNALHTQVTFLDLFGCRRVEELNSFTRWTENRTRDRIKAPIGIGNGNRPVYLDVHEKFHGPHGLAAGTTGSGKSELLQTYLLSLAVSFSPQDINFFIIDYKGGGMGNFLQKLPHCAGVISNLSGKQIKRALSSVRSENKRRQQQLSLGGVNHIDDYGEKFRNGLVSQPMPHLIVVVDEFAELKKEEPGFMQEIISVAQVGRSLGVHLILATQKPAGTVDDKIWSNSKFRLCLRVQDRQDSMDMLHRPDAANLIKAGQCYIQVGNHEVYQLFQAGYSGAGYMPDHKEEKGPYIVSNTGKRISDARKEETGLPTQSEAVISYIGKIASQTGAIKARNLWMPELAQHITLAEAKVFHTADASSPVTVILGVCDDPEQQKQYTVSYQPLRQGNLCLCGAPAVGKSTFLQTVLWQLCRNYEPWEVQFLMAAPDSAGVRCFEKMPHCLGNMKSGEEGEIFFYHLERLFQKRKEKLSGISFEQYLRRKEGKETFLFLIIDNFGSFRQMTADRYQTLIERLAGEGINYGIYLLITGLGTGSGEIPVKLFEKLKVTLTLEMSDRFQYGDVLRQYHSNVLPEENIKGRGLCKTGDRVLELQVPVLAEGDDYERIRQVEELEIEILHKKLSDTALPEKFPVLPKKPLYSKLLEQYEETGKEKKAGLPLGYDLETAYIAEIILEAGFSFVISGGTGSGKRNLLLCLMKGMDDRNKQIAVIDRKNIISGKEVPQKAIIMNHEKEFLNWSKEVFSEERNTAFKDCCLCLCDLADFTKMLQGQTDDMQWFREQLEKRIEQNSLFPIFILQQPGREMEAIGTPLYEWCVRNQWGIHLGGNAGGQRLLAFDDLDYSRQTKRELPGIGYLKTGPGTKTKRIRIPFYKGGE